MLRQEKLWQSDFGQQYTERNVFSPQELDVSYIEDFGVSRTKLNQEFLNGLVINNILEVGSNVGNQLRSLQSIGFNNLYGIEIQSYAVERAKSLTSNINIIQASAFDLPFKDNYFDLVYTSGVLIHISPNDIQKVIKEMIRVSKKYIWGFEYFSEQYVEVAYRGMNSAMWKGNFKQMFLDENPNLRIVNVKKVPYLRNKNVDEMYLLEKN